ncbi:Wzz/FepE/Etk N-terminal domain-containing protein [Aridibaculum aurantiacum]|uniref:Wzz/FepE/Etk N-terminal domain-containing protein n=1 Tax=Aridibaculum aurantiacum TaxID=2810307 RepID=UPI001A95C0AF|nr:Wzz/FepE/Etk N-terminal domain-containing protein [Aridibaculum aurantiacum]
MSQPSSEFNLAGVWQVIIRHRKIIATFVAVVVLLAALLLFFVLPKYYKSEAVIVATNPALADKSRLLNNNVQHLYSPYGNGDDLGRLLGIASMDTVYQQLVEQFKLEDYYEVSDTRGAEKAAVKALQDDVKLLKTENNELYISVTTKDRHLSSNIANRMVELIASTAERSWRKEYASSLTALQTRIEKEELELVALENMIRTGRTEGAQIALLSKRAALVEQLQQLYKASNEYQLAIDNQPAALVVMQHASPAVTHHKPRKGDVLVAVFLASLAFAVIAAVVYDRKWSS